MYCTLDGIIKDRGGVLLTKLHKTYIDTLKETGLEDPTYQAHSLQMKLKNVNKDYLRIDKITNKLGFVVFSNDIDIGQAYAYP